MDILDIGWDIFLKKCGLDYELINNKENKISSNYLRQFKGIIFTGGNSLMSCNGDSRERDMVEKKIYRLAINMQIPIIGVCRVCNLFKKCTALNYLKFLDM